MKNLNTFKTEGKNLVYLCRQDIHALAGASLEPGIDVQNYAGELLIKMRENAQDTTGTKIFTPEEILQNVLNQAHKNITKRFQTLERYKTKNMGEMTTLQLKNIIRTNPVSLCTTQDPFFDSKCAAVQKFCNIGANLITYVNNRTKGAAHRERKKAKEVVAPGCFDSKKLRPF